jgi:hypothetical protein
MWDFTGLVLWTMYGLGWYPSPPAEDLGPDVASQGAFR